MSITTYKSKEGKKLYEVYVGIKARGKKLQKRRRKDFQGNFISSLPKAKKVEFELKRELVGQKEGQPIWKWKDWLEECLRKMRFTLKYSTVFDYEKLLASGFQRLGMKKSYKLLRGRKCISLFFEDICSSPPHQKKKVHKMLRRIFQMAIEEGGNQ